MDATKSFDIDKLWIKRTSECTNLSQDEINRQNLTMIDLIVVGVATTTPRFRTAFSRLRRMLGRTTVDRSNFSV